MKPPAQRDPAVFSFIDLSNVWYGLRQAALDHDEEPRAVRLYADHLADVLRAGRSDFTQVAVANAQVPPPVIAHFERIGVVFRREVGELSGTEQANDETLQVRMYEVMHQHPKSVMVLATGDGEGWKVRRGFLHALDAARQHKWGVELVAWRDITNRALIDWVESVGGVFVDLNEHYYSVAFVEGGRTVQPVNLRHRPTAEPAGWAKT